MSQIILMAETGSDIPADLAKKEGIELVPMHVSFGDTTKDDGSFPPSDVVTFYKETGILPKPAAVFRKILLSHLTGFMPHIRMHRFCISLIPQLPPVLIRVL